MEERSYRASRLLTALGNPLRFQIVEALKDGKKTPAELASLFNRSVSTVSGHLAVLRSLDVVRYDSEAGRVYYWLKRKQILDLLARAKRCADAMEMKSL